MKAAAAITSWVLRLALGSVLIYSGLVKIAKPYEFLNSVLGYRLLDQKTATVAAAVLPCLELSLGIALVCGICTLGASLLASALFLTFSIGQASALARGISADCGCFGAGEPVSWLSLGRTAVLFAAALLSFLVSLPISFPDILKQRPPAAILIAARG